MSRMVRQMRSLSTKRQLGLNGPYVSALGLGVMGMSDFYNPSAQNRDAEHIKLLHEAIDMGCTFWDTADVYGPYTNEILISKVLKERRNEVFVGTKFGFVRNPDGSFDGICGKPEYVFKSCDASLKRLGVETIDLYYQHRPDPNVPITETVQAMSELVKQGKVRYLGLSECSAEQIRLAHKVHPISAYQAEFSPWHTKLESDGRLEACRELGIAIVPYSPLGRGFLTGTIKSFDDLDPNDWRRKNPRFQKGAFEKNFELVKAFTRMAQAKGVPTSQLCLAWVLSQGNDFIPIPGTKRSKYLKENWGSLQVELSDKEKKELRKIINEIPIEGGQLNILKK
ncbi:hypothetical protein HDV04_006177 [Boothiomyces sp. JEL0838]|nr:hypothetical protein HDV04_006177 [Boothiomyces sp. JEL0838]